MYIITRRAHVFNLQKYYPIIQMKDKPDKQYDVNMIIIETNNKDILSTSFPEWITILYSLKKNPSNKTCIGI